MIARRFVLVLAVLGSVLRPPAAFAVPADVSDVT
jgi:hypothetical protein